MLTRCRVWRFDVGSAAYSVQSTAPSLTIPLRDIACVRVRLFMIALL